VRVNGGGMQILVTNNPLVEAQYKSRLQVIFYDTDLPGIRSHVRDLIHKGHRLLTHPLSGSVKPNETLYKSILITDKQENTDMQSVNIIEECILAAQKFTKKNIPEKYMDDLQIVDLSLIRSALE